MRDPRGLHGALRLLRGPELDYPNDQMEPSGILNKNGDFVDDGFDVGRVAIGQGGEEGQILATPLQMAEVAAAIGNGGKLMRPRLTDRVVRKDGRVKERVEPDLQSQVMKPETAEQLTQMMGRVVEEGTGTAAALSRRRRGGQDRHRRGGRQPRVHAALVHRLRPDRQPAHGRRRDARAAAAGPRAAPWPRRSRRGARGAAGEADDRGRRQHAGRRRATGSCTASAPAGWPTCTSPRTPTSAARWR